MKKSKTTTQAKSLMFADWQVVGGLFLIWRTLLLVWGALANNLLPYKPSFPYAEVLLLNRNLPTWLASWANFDGVHYLTIVEKGYFGTGLIQAFFPLYPSLVWLVSRAGVDPLLAGVILSNLLFVALQVVIYRYIKIYFGNTHAIWSVVALLVFPTSFYFGALYTESLFLLLVVGTLWVGQRKQWVWAACLAALASATRIVGIFLIPALLVELFQNYYQVNKTKPNALISPNFWLTFLRHELANILIVSLGGLGLAAYMLYLQVVFHDPLYFYHVQSEFGGGRQESLVLLPQVLWRYAKILITYRPFDFKYFSFVQELVATLFAYLVLVMTAKKVRWSMTVFALLAITLPTLTGTLSSMPRYILIALPIFIYIGELVSTKKKVGVVWLVLSALLLLLNTLLFIQGYWVA